MATITSLQVERIQARHDRDRIKRHRHTPGKPASRPDADRGALLDYIRQQGNLLVTATARATKAEAQAAEAEQSERYERADKMQMLREQNQPYYVPTSVQLPNAGVAVLLQPFLESSAPEIGRLRYDEAGPYWQMNHARSMKYDLDNYQGWVYVPKAFVSQKDAPTPLPSSPDAAGPGEASKFFLNGDPSINPFGPR